MAKFAIVATFDVAEGRMDEFLPLLLAHRDRWLKDEPGTLRFDAPFWPSGIDSRRRNFALEVWSSRTGDSFQVLAEEAQGQGAETFGTLEEEDERREEDLLRLGGYDAITAVANDLLPRLQADPQLGRFWAHRGGRRQA